MKGLFCLLVLTAFAGGCLKIDNPSSATPAVKQVAYYRFEAEDTLRIPVSRVGDQIRFRSDDGAERTFTVDEVESSYHEIYGVGMGFFGPYAATYFYYDTKTIQYEALANYIDFSITYRKWPVDNDAAMADKYTRYPAKMYVQMTWFPYWNGLNERADPDIYIRVPDSPKTDLDIDGQRYRDVVRIQSNNPDTISSIRNVNTVYYADGWGVIGYDEVGGRKWRIRR